MKIFNYMNKIDLSKYMGKWYEIARTDFMHQQNLINSEANYSLSHNKVNVLNVGFNTKTNKLEFWEAYLETLTTYDNIFVLTDLKRNNNKSLYEILYVSDNYEYAIVTNTKDLVWILSRNKQVSSAEYEKLISILKENNYDIDCLIKI